MRDKDGQGIMTDLSGFTITVASGKGGTGKTTVAVNLAWLIAETGQTVQYLDCDVEEPNGHIFLKPEINESRVSKVMVPVVDQGRCTSCGDCGANCAFHAIVNLPGDTLIFPGLCHSCGLCTSLCSARALVEGEREIGLIERGTGLCNIDFAHGILNVGEAMAVPLIRQVKQCRNESRLHILDAPPGTSCPVVSALNGSDAVIMVTEPTPFGLHDLMIAVDVAKWLDIPTGVVINRDNGGYLPLSSYLEANDVPVLGVIPEDADIARHYSRGDIILESIPHYRNIYESLAVNVKELLFSRTARVREARS